MATTGQNFVQLTVANLIGSTYQAAGAVLALNPANAAQIVSGGTGTAIDRLGVDLSLSSFAKNGAAVATLVGTTPLTLDLTDLTSGTSGTSAWAGDTTFAKWNQIVITNTGTADFTVAQGASNGARLLLAGTTPTLTVPAGSSITLATLAGLVVDSTHKVITVTPTANSSLAIAVGGS